MLEEDAKVLLDRANLPPLPATPPGTFTQNYHHRYDDFRSSEYCP